MPPCARMRWFVILVSIVCPVQMMTGQKSNDGEKTPPRFSSQTLSQSVPGSEDDALRTAKVLTDSSKFTEASALVTQYLSTHPNSADAHFLLGLIRFKQGEPAGSLAEFTEGARYRDPAASDLKIVALNYVLLGDMGSAVGWLTRAVVIDPRDAQLWYYLGRAKYNQNRFQDAINAFQRCLALDPKNIKAEDNLGLSYQGLGRTDEALTAFGNSMAWQKDRLEKNVGPFLNMGILHLEQNRIAEGLPFLLQAAQIAPDDARPHEQLGKAYSRLDELEKAQSELEKAVELSPNSSSLRFMLGQLYRKRGMMDKAKIELDKGSVLRDSEHQKMQGVE